MLKWIFYMQTHTAHYSCYFVPMNREEKLLAFFHANHYSVGDHILHRQKKKNCSPQVESGYSWGSILVYEIFVGHKYCLSQEILFKWRNVGSETRDLKLLKVVEVRNRILELG